MSYTAVVEPTETKDGAAFMASLPPKHLAPLWTEMSKMVPSRPNPKAVPVLWKYTEMRPSLMEAGEIVDAEEAERRVLMLVEILQWVSTHYIVSLGSGQIAYSIKTHHIQRTQSMVVSN
jgi:gentisate 1,2-dioxygenase